MMPRRLKPSAALLPLLLACGPSEGISRELRKTYEDGVTVRVIGTEVLLDGEWVMEGAAVFFDPEGGKIAEGQYSAGLETGAWTRWLEDGTRTEGSFEAGKRTGTWTFWHAEGSRQEQGAYEGGLREGPWKRWYPGGALREENDYVAGKMHGQRRAYELDGSLDRERSGLFEEGVRVAPLPR